MERRLTKENFSKRSAGILTKDESDSLLFCEEAVALLYHLGQTKLGHPCETLSNANLSVNKMIIKFCLLVHDFGLSYLNREIKISHLMCLC